MDIKTVIMETLGMMGFTFLVGFGVAYTIKLLVEVFYFFWGGNVTNFIHDYRVKFTQERIRQAKMKRNMFKTTRGSEVELLKYIEENRNKYDVEEQVDDTYELFKFYRGIYKDKKENEGINELIKYYNGEV